MATKAKRQWLSSVKKHRDDISRRRRARRGTLYSHLVGTAGGHAWEDSKNDGLADGDREAQVVHTAGEAGGDAECSQCDDELLHSSGTECGWKCVQCGQLRIAPGSDMCNACSAEAACVDGVMQHGVRSSSEACLAHESMTELGPLESQKESQDPRAFLSTPGRPHGLPHYRLHCPAEDLVEGTEDCVALMPVQKH